jgi:hypothetical protein
VDSNAENAGKPSRVMESFVPTNVCPRCNEKLEPVAVREGFRPHMKCPGCGRVFVPHEGCTDRKLVGLHPCDNAPEHLDKKVRSK